MRKRKKQLAMAMTSAALLLMIGCGDAQNTTVSTADFEQETMVEIAETETKVLDESEALPTESALAEPETEAWETMSVEQLLQDKRYPAALSRIRAIGSPNLNLLEDRLRERIDGDFIVSGTGYVSAKRQDGTALIAYSEAYREEDRDPYPSRLKIDFFVEGSYPGAVTEEGTYITVWRDPQEVKAYNDAYEQAAYENGGCIGVWMTRENEGSQAIYDWTDIALMAAGYPEWGVAITKSGVPVHVGWEDYVIPAEQMTELEAWTDIVDLEAQGVAHLAGLRRDGVVVDHLGQPVDGMDDMVAIDVSEDGVLIGLRADGTLQIFGEKNGTLASEVARWTDLYIPDPEDLGEFK